MRFLFLSFFLFCAALGHAKVRYDSSKVYRLKPETQEQKDLLLALENGDNDLDFWNGVNNANLPVDIMVSAKDQHAFTNAILKNGMSYDVMIDDVQQLIDAENSAVSARAGMTWDSYYRLAGIYSWLEELAAEYSTVTVVDAGSTHEGRVIKGVKISFGPGKKGVFVEGGMHAREWISPATVTYIINEVLTSTNPTFRKIAESFDWYLFPVANPDGYEFTHTNTRLWRKTRTPYQLGCFGADPNRNWDAHWGSAGTSNVPCADTYGGPRVFSEVETRTLSEYISTIGADLDVFLGFHSYGQMMLMPYGHTTAHLDNHDDVLQIGRAAIAALASRYNTRYVVGNIAETIYLASGSSMDWVKQTFKTPIAFTYELRDSGAFGFVLPASQIVPNCLEVMDSIVAIFEEGEKLGYFTLG